MSVLVPRLALGNSGASKDGEWLGMRTCEAIYGAEQAEAIEDLVMLATGEDCPCRRGLPCPLTDEAGCNPLASLIPRSV